MRSLLTGLVLIVAVSGFAWSAERPSDSDIRASILGTWIVPADSSDSSTENQRMLEVFAPDGTYTTYFYKDAECAVLVNQVVTRWTVVGGILTSFYPNGGQERDEIVSIDSTTMTLHSLDDGTTYTRSKSTTCARGKPAA